MNATDFVSCLRSAGWIISDCADRDAQLISPVLLRYPSIPPSFLDFLRLVDLCIHPDEDAWILTRRIYNDTGEFAFAWNEWERLSLQAAKDAGDGEWTAKIISFWDYHLPIAMSVRSGYSYLAVAVGQDNRVHDFGTVLYGREPEFEDSSVVSTSVSDFFAMASGYVLGKVEADFLSDFF